MQQWLRDRATLLRYTYVAYIVGYENLAYMATTSIQIINEHWRYPSFESGRVIQSTCQAFRMLGNIHC